MTALIRKQLQLSQDSISRLQQLSDRYHLSEAELVRRAIQAYDPEQAQSVSDESEEAVLSMLGCMREALRSALETVDSTNVNVHQALSDLADPAQRRILVEEVRKEVADNSALLDEISVLLHPKRKDH